MITFLTVPPTWRNTILKATLVAGSLDIAAAFVNYFIKTGNPPERVLWFIASGVMGSAAFQGGTLVALAGLALHYLIAGIWVVLYVLAWRRVIPLRKRPVLSGLAYGVFIWLAMNLLVVPLSRTPELPFSWSGALTGVLILMLAVGLPIALIVQGGSSPQAQAVKTEAQ